MLKLTQECILGCQRIDLEKILKKIKNFFYKKMFQGPKGYIAQMCEVHLQFGNNTTKWVFYTFFRLNSSLYFSILFVCTTWE